MSKKHSPLYQSRIRLANPVSVSCPHCRTELEYQKPLTLGEGAEYRIKCGNVKCEKIFEGVPFGEKKKTASSNGGLGGEKKKGRIGTSEKPLDTTYYEILNVSPQATQDEIKSAYRRLAIKLHPDKNLGDPGADEKFKTLAIAYQTLSDPTLRKKYNEFGPKGAELEEGMVDPEALFSQLFGGERFADIIGTISLGQDMKTVMQDEDEDPDFDVSKAISDAKTTEDLNVAKAKLEEKKRRKKEKEDAVAAERAKIRKERVDKLAEKLERKLELYTEQADYVEVEDPDVAKSVRAIWTIETEELKTESYGVELLQTVGFVYSSKSRHYLASAGPVFGFAAGWFHSAKSTAHVFSETVSTLRSAYELKDIFTELEKAEKEGNLTEEKKRELEEKAATKGMQALFKGAKLEVESVVREVCDRILATGDQEKRTMKAVALGILGGVYESVKKEGDIQADYVKVDPTQHR
ncbi:DnaJ-domain-containing protein [Atractiella rhizophila]|nr:DnaJ-domain-containing protein [Atractiella rhizophila]